MLSVSNHDRDKAKLTYVYPVLSRRAGGLSIGINLNINHACNWRCIYCQVPDLKRGSAPPVNFETLGKELRFFLSDVLQGDFYERESIAEEYRVIKDIAISGNGEPTSSAEFDQVINLISLIMQEFGLNDRINCVLITNGSLVRRKVVQNGLKKLSTINGEIWFKIDSASREGQAFINNINGSGLNSLRHLEIASALCPTWIQSCFFAWKKRPPAKREINAYLSLLDAIQQNETPIKGVLLYGVAREPHQGEAKYISALPESWFIKFAERMQHYNFDVRINP
ncbi:MAG: radical SAM protein [Pseudomonadota bacterium]